LVLGHDGSSRGRRAGHGDAAARRRELTTPARPHLPSTAERDRPGEPDSAEREPAVPHHDAPAANDDYLVGDRDGHAMLCTPEGSRRFEFSPGAVKQLGRELEIKDW
jgi:hypothetical protein